jgi:hypothetical protein
VHPLTSKSIFLCLSAFLTCLGSATSFTGEAGSPERYAQPIPMPEGRAKDSSETYSQLLKNGPIEWRNVGRKHLVVG